MDKQAIATPVVGSQRSNHRKYNINAFQQKKQKRRIDTVVTTVTLVEIYACTLFIMQALLFKATELLNV